jgi:hypothetical protein
MIPVDLSALAADPEPVFVEIGKHQPEYLTLPALVYNDGKTLIEFSLTEEERTRLIKGENIRLWIFRSFRCKNCDASQPFQPIAIEVTDEHHA